MKRVFIGKQFKVGDRVKGSCADEEYTGTIFCINQFEATIRRDDEIEGNGAEIEGYGSGWRVMRNESGKFFSDGRTGDYLIRIE